MDECWFFPDTTENIIATWIGITIFALPIFQSLIFPRSLKSLGNRQLIPHDMLPAHDLAWSKAKHSNMVNNLLHFVTNQLIAISMMCMLDNTPAPSDSLSWAYFELNMAGIYLTFHILYYFYIQPATPSVFIAVMLVLLYLIRVPFTKLVGTEHVFVYLGIYLFGQLSQILVGHFLLEGSYNLYFSHTFTMQQWVGWMNVALALGLFPDLEAEKLELVPAYQADHSLLPRQKEGVDSPYLAFLRGIHWINLYVFPHYTFFAGNMFSFCPPIQNTIVVPGLLQLVVHRKILEQKNLLEAPYTDLRKSWAASRTAPTCPLKFRPDDGYGTDIDHPTTGCSGFAIGRNMEAIPKHLRNNRGAPDAQLVAQRLLAREGFTPAGDQLNIIAAAWIQAQVHGWMGHLDGALTEMGNGQGLCPLGKFKFFETKERDDGHYNSERTQWWDASFLYGQDSEQVTATRSSQGGKLKVNETQPNTIASRKDGTYYVGDNHNSWLGIELLKELFLKEHNYICDMLAAKYPTMTDDELYGYSRNIIAAQNAKIHTIDWTVELLKTKQLEVGMKTNWMGLSKSMYGKWAPGNLFKIIGKKKANNRGVPFVLTEEFAAVYRLHPLCPPGVILGDDVETFKDAEWVPFSELLGVKGRDLIRRDSKIPLALMKSMYSYPCGHLVGANYPEALRDVEPTDKLGVGKGEDMKVDLAAIDLFRDRERGILPYNDFRRKVHLKPFHSWLEMTGDRKAAQRLEVIYGPAPHGIEKCDLLVGDLYEKKLEGFAISETSFIIFLLMASRRLDADPFLNELYDEEHYTKEGLEHIEETDGLLDLLKRHYPKIAAPFVERKQSAFKPLLGPEKWAEAISKKVVDPKLVEAWEETKRANDEYFDNMVDDNWPVNIE